MFSHTVEYVDFNNKKCTETIYFNMLAPEWADLEFNPTFEEGGGLADYLAAAMKSGDNRRVYTFFKLMIVNAYGRRTEDGARFFKKVEWTEEFLNSLAYEEFFIWLMNEKNAQEFWHGIMPQKLMDAADAIETGAGKKKITELSREELLELFNKRMNEKSIESSGSK